MTPAEARAAHDTAIARDAWLTRAITAINVEQADKHVARAHQAIHHGGTLLPGALVVNTLDELQVMLAAGLTRCDQTSMLPAEMTDTNCHN